MYPDRSTILGPFTEFHIHPHPSPSPVIYRGSSNSYVIAALPALVALRMLDIGYHAVIGVDTKNTDDIYARPSTGRQKKELVG